MFRKMRRFKQLLPEQETVSIIDGAKTGVLGVIGDDGYPYTVPVNHMLVGNRIYFHSAREGHKVDAIRKCPKVSFSFIDKEDVISREFTTYFRSAQVFGSAVIVQDQQEKDMALLKFCEKFCSADMDRFEEVMANEASQAIIIRVDIEQMTGKEAIELVKARKQG